VDPRDSKILDDVELLATVQLLCAVASWFCVVDRPRAEKLLDQVAALLTDRGKAITCIAGLELQ
jgi:hypothetical protein